jgi:hypothetical protein
MPCEIESSCRGATLAINRMEQWWGGDEGVRLDRAGCTIVHFRETQDDEGIVRGREAVVREGGLTR